MTDEEIALMEELLEEVREHHADNDWQQKPGARPRNNKKWAVRNELINQAGRIIVLAKGKK